MTTASELTWATTGAINSRDHVAVIEPYQMRALCGIGIAAGTTEIRPATLNLCPGCARELKRLGIKPDEIGIENELTADVVRAGSTLERALNGRDIAALALNRSQHLALEDYETGLVDALANLQHFARRYEIDFDNALAVATRHHAAEARYAWDEVPS